MLEGKTESTDAAFLEALLSLRPELAGQLGLPARPGLPDPSLAGRAAVIDTLERWRDARDRDERLAVDDPYGFGLDQRVFSASLELLRYSEQELMLFRNDPDILRDPVLVLLHDRKAAGVAPAQLTEGLVDRLSALPEYLSLARATVDKPDRILAQEARATIDGARAVFRALLRDTKRGAVDGTLPLSLVSDMENATSAAEEAMVRQAQWLDALPVEGDRWRLGREFTDHLLLLRGLDINAAELRAFCISAIEEMRLERSRLLHRCFGGQSLDEALAASTEQRPLSSQELCAWLGELVEQVRVFVGDFFPVPEAESVVIETVPEGFGALPFGGHALVPARDARSQSRLVVPRAETAETLGQYNLAALENLIAFFGYPGVHLFRVSSERSSSIARRGVPAGFVASVAGTWGQDTLLGWAQYAEDYMREQGFRDSPSARLVAIQNSLYRALLAYVDISLCDGTLDPARAQRILTQHGGVSSRVAAADVRQCLRRPSEALSCLLGRMRLTQLRREAKILWRGDYHDRRFHQFVLSAGPMPLAYHFELLDVAAIPHHDGTAEYDFAEVHDEERASLEALVADIPLAPAELPSVGFDDDEPTITSFETSEEEPLD